MYLCVVGCVLGVVVIEELGWGVEVCEGVWKVWGVVFGCGCVVVLVGGGKFVVWMLVWFGCVVWSVVVVVVGWVLVVVFGWFCGWIVCVVWVL